MISAVKTLIKTWLGRPFAVLAVCLLFLAWNLLAGGAVFQIFSLSGDLGRARARTRQFQSKTEWLKKEISKASDPDFVEGRARERLDFAGEGELIFIFPDKI